MIEDYTTLAIGNIGSRLKFLRKRKKITQKEMATHLSVSTRQYGRYEKNKNNIPITKLVVLSDKLNVSIDFILTGKEG